MAHHLKIINNCTHHDKWINDAKRGNHIDDPVSSDKRESKMLCLNITSRPKKDRL